MRFVKGRSLIERIASGIVACSMVFSTMASNAFASEASHPQDNIIGGTGITITVDENGNIISATNSANKNQTNDNKDEVSMNSPSSSDKSDVGESSINTEEKPSVEDIATPEKFDKYYSLIDDNTVQTNTLFIQTSNFDVFPKNINIVSNYENLYVVEFDSIEEARYAYSFYVNKVDFISDLSDAIVLASNNGNDNKSTNIVADLNDIGSNDYSGYIALIDTGASGADAYLSVFGDNILDYNGHGTLMYNLIKAENPDAKILSIKAFEDRTTNVVNLYKAIKMAIEANVSVINLSLAGYDIDKNSIIIDVIKEALDKGITIVGAAGNYNDSALNYIPGCINGVITVGAIYANKTKYSSSNYDADVYVVAKSTSEATAKYTGMLTADSIDENRTTAELVDKSKYPDLPDNGDKNSTGTHDDKKAA